MKYRHVGVDWIVIVAGTPIPTAKRRNWNLNENDVCGGENQGVLSKRGQLKVTRLVQSTGHWCKDYGTDEKEYWLFADRAE